MFDESSAAPNLNMDPDMRKLYEMFASATSYIAEVATSRAKLAEQADRIAMLENMNADQGGIITRQREDIANLTQARNDAQWRVGELEHDNEILRTENGTLRDRQRSDETTIADLQRDVAHLTDERDNNFASWQSTQVELDDVNSKLGKITETFKGLGLHLEEPEPPLPEPKSTLGAANYGEHDENRWS